MNDDRKVPDYSFSEQPAKDFNTSMQDHAPAQNTPNTKSFPVHATPRNYLPPVVQQHEAAPQVQAVADTPPPLTQANRPDTDFTVSVEQARETLAVAGFKRSKDTVQRYCRDGTLEARKLGMFSRFFITQNSLDVFLEKMQLDAGVSAFTDSDVKLHEDAEDTASEETQDLDANASDEMQAQTGASSGNADPHTGARRRTPDDAQLHGSAGVGDEVLRAKLDAARDMIDRLAEENEFLRDEVRQSRHQRGDVVDISKQMLNTLETMAVGRKLEAPSSQNQTVRAEVVRNTDREREGSATYAPSDKTRSAGDSV